MKTKQYNLATIDLVGEHEIATFAVRPVTEPELLAWLANNPDVECLIFDGVLVKPRTSISLEAVEAPVQSVVKAKRKRRTKAEIEAARINTVPVGSSVHVVICGEEEPTLDGRYCTFPVDHKGNHSFAPKPDKHARIKILGEQDDGSMVPVSGGTVQS